MRQKLCKSGVECKTFFESLPGDAASISYSSFQNMSYAHICLYFFSSEPRVCIIKPNESAGSDSIYKCTTSDQLLGAFEKINGELNYLGHANEGSKSIQLIKFAKLMYSRIEYI